MNATTNPGPAVTGIKINSLESVDITTSDGITRNAGSITNAIANKNATSQQLHDALAAFHASAVAGAKEAGGEAATAAMEPAHAFIASLFAKGALTPADVSAGAAAIADASQTSNQRALAKAQKAVDDAAAGLAKLKAQQATAAGKAVPA